MRMVQDQTDPLEPIARITEQSKNKVSKLTVFFILHIAFDVVRYFQEERFRFPVSYLRALINCAIAAIKAAVAATALMIRLMKLLFSGVSYPAACILSFNVITLYHVVM